LPGKVETSERKKRNKILRILSEKKKRKFYEKMIGKDLEVLFEDENNEGKMKGFSSNYVRIIEDYNPSELNKLTSFKITGISNDGLCTGKYMDTKKSIELISL
jgi:threonylcarbamoyladenosine tRNA methylthiotransferase MtaB